MQTSKSASSAAAAASCSGVSVISMLRRPQLLKLLVLLLLLLLRRRGQGLITTNTVDSVVHQHEPLDHGVTHIAVQQLNRLRSRLHRQTCGMPRVARGVIVGS
jgi:hypothetical protein